MKGEEIFDFHLGEKVYTLDTYHDESIDLIAVGLKNTILIYQISDEKENNQAKPTLIQAVSKPYDKTKYLNVSSICSSLMYEF